MSFAHQLCTFIQNRLHNLAFYSFQVNICAKPYVVIHEDTGQAVKAWFPDFPDLTSPSDHLGDTLTIAPLVLQQHVEEMNQQEKQLPNPTTPDLWDIYAKHSSALIGFVKISIAEG
jgi:hypothetical protein